MRRGVRKGTEELRVRSEGVRIIELQERRGMNTKISHISFLHQCVKFHDVRQVQYTESVVLSIQCDLYM